MSNAITRREFCQSAVMAGAVAGAAGADPATKPSPMPTIKLGALTVSRLILGSNPFFGFSHGNPQASGKEMKEFYTKEKTFAVLDAAAEQGIDAVWTPCYPQWISLWTEYRKNGGKLRNWIGQPDRLPMDKEIMKAVENGATAICVQGERVDGEIRKGNWDVVRAWVELIRTHKLPAGIASHTATHHLLAEEKGLPTDFYNQTLYRPDKYVEEGLVESLAAIDRIAKPVIAYKVLGAGRIAPKEALPRLFKRLKAKDGICLGMFPKKHDEIAENAQLVRELGAVA